MGALSHRAELVFEMVQTRIALLQGILRELCKSWGGNSSGCLQIYSRQTLTITYPVLLCQGPYLGMDA